MNELNQRLRAERTRLSLTQDDFAKLCGVGRRAQAAYESGERVPDATYLIAAGKSGVDTRYLLSGIQRDNVETSDYSVEALFRALCSELGISAVAVEDAILETRKVPSQASNGYGAMRTFEALSQRLVSQSIRLNLVERTLELDSDILVDIIRELELCLAKMEARNVSPAQKALTVCRLYRASAEVGKIDIEYIHSAALNLIRVGSL